MAIKETVLVSHQAYDWYLLLPEQVYGSQQPDSRHLRWLGNDNDPEEVLHLVKEAEHFCAGTGG
ncbi:hypothetical protein ES708_32237 [subsurface metagenome]